MKRTRQLGLGLVLALVAASAAGGTISGTVYAPGARPLAGAVVSALADDAIAGMATAGATGAYQITGLPAGSYRVEFFDPSGWYAREFHEDQVFHWSGARVDVGAASAIQGIDATLTYATPAPAVVAATDGDYADRVAISWDPVPGAASYQVYRADVAGGAATSLGPWQPGLSFNDPGTLPTRTYHYTVRAAVGAAGERPSALSPVDEGWRALTAPTGVAATDGAFFGNVTVAWQAVPGATHYRVFRAESLDGPKTELGVWQAGLAFKDYLAYPAQDFSYFVQAAGDAAGFRPSAFSQADPGWRALAPPTGVSASDGAYADRVSVTWPEVLGATWYRVYRSEAATGPKTAIGYWQSARFFEDTGIPSAKTYHYHVLAAVGSSGERPSGFSAAEPGWQALFAPGGVAATDGAFYGNTTVTWQPVPQATHYRVYRAETPDGPLRELGSWQTGLSFKDYIGQPARTYLYFVRAAAGGSGWRPSERGLPDEGWRALAAPTGVAATDGAFYGNTTIQWQAVPGATHYRVYRSDRATDPKTELGIWQTETAFKDYLGDPAKTYHYHVQAAVGPAGERSSAFSGADSGWRALAPPTGLLATDGERADGVATSWHPVPGATHYRVYRSERADGPKVELGPWQSGLSLHDASALPAKTYHYFVRAAAGGSGWRPGGFSAMDAGWRGLAAPAGVAATDGAFFGNVTVAWLAVPGATHYRVYRAETPEGAAVELGAWQVGLAFKDYQANPGATYHYFVRAAAGGSGWRPGLLSAGDGGWRALAAPAGLAATGGTRTDAIGLSWAASRGATHYRVHRAELPSGVRAPLGGWIEGVAFADATAIPGRDYQYWVQAATDADGSRPSGLGVSGAGYRGLAAPVPVALLESAESDAIQLDWGAVAGASHYRVCRTESPAAAPVALGGWQTARGHLDATAVAGKLYYYYVQGAVDAAGLRAGEFGVAVRRIPGEAVWWHVDAARPDDAGAGLDWATAKRTLQAAVDAAADGDTILVARGVYEPVATDNKPLLIESVDGAVATVIDGGGVLRCATLGNDAWLTNTVLCGFTLRNGCAEFGGGALGGMLEGCRLDGNLALEGGGAYGSTLINCVLLRNAAELGGGACEAMLFNCTVAGNVAILSGGGVYGGEAVNSIVWGNANELAETDNCAETALRFSCTWPPHEGAGNLVADPAFVDPDAGDYRLSPASPCIDAGRSEAAQGAVDVDGLPRLVGAAVDMGAHEAQP